MQTASDIEDRALLGLAMLGDHRAFEQLVVPHRPVMLNAAQQINPSRDDAEDAVQDTLIAFWRDCLVNAEWLATIGSPAGLLVFRTRQSAIRILQRQQALKRGGKDVHAFDVEVRRSLYGLLAHKRGGSVVETCEPSPDHDAAFKRLGMVHRLAPQLPAALLGPLNAFYSGEPISSMAQRRGCSVDTVRGTLSAGIQVLRHLAAKDPDCAELVA